jgi:hypothetical protein
MKLQVSRFEKRAAAESVACAQKKDGEKLASVV